jgi:hypothetical protein
LDFGKRIGNWEIFGQLGGISGELEISKSKSALEIGLWKIDGFEKAGSTFSQSINLPQDPPRVVKHWDTDADVYLLIDPLQKDSFVGLGVEAISLPLFRPAKSHPHQGNGKNQH